MQFLLDPNVAYLIVLAGLFLAVLAVVTPGTGLLEVSATFCLFLAGYAVYHLAIHWWAIVLLLLSVVPFVLAVRKPYHQMYLAIAIVFLVIGSVFLFASQEGLWAVNPVIALVASGLMAVSLWIIVRKSIEVISRRPVHDLDALIGQVGVAKTPIYSDGNIYVAGEIWSARSNGEIPTGSQARVLRRDGFVLVVEKINQINS